MSDELAPGLTAEAAVIGACLLSPGALRGVAATLEPDDFELDAHRLVLATMLGQLGDGEPADLVTVTEALAITDRLDEVGGAEALALLIGPDTCPLAGSWEAYARVVRTEAARRRAIDALRRGIERLEAGEPPDEVLADLGRPPLRVVADDAEVVG